MLFYSTDADKAIAVVYDLRDPTQWIAAGKERQAWGRERTVIHTRASAHIIIEYKAGGALEASA